MSFSVDLLIKNLSGFILPKKFYDHKLHRLSFYYHDENTEEAFWKRKFKKCNQEGWMAFPLVYMLLRHKFFSITDFHAPPSGIKINFELCHICIYKTTL